MGIESNSAAVQSKLIDSTLYLASLASDTKVTDPLLDTLRTITASRNEETLTPSDKQELMGMQARLKNYLVNEDPVRRFDTAVLEQKVYEHTLGQDHFAGLRKAMAIIVSLALVLWVILTALGNRISWISESHLPELSAIAITFAGAALLHLRAIKTFEPAIKRAYVYFCVPITMLAAFYLHFGYIDL